MAQTAPKDHRNADLAMIHMAAKSLFGDTSKGAPSRGDYEAWLERHTGKRSAGGLTSAERAALVTKLRREGLLKDRDGRGKGGTGGAGADRPTAQQWSHIGGLARQMGWDNGLEDPALQTFVCRTAKVSAARFITRTQASAVILGLQKWLAQKAAQGDGGEHALP